MAFDEALAGRIREQLAGTKGVVEKKMFGGLAFLANGNMSVGVHGAEMIVRVDPETTDAAVKLPGVRIFDITGRPMKGWLLVSGAQVEGKAALAKWVKQGVAFAFSLPRKK